MDSLAAVRRELDRGREQRRAANPELYRDLALYLQVLREVLQAAVEQASFHLATRFQAQRYCELPVERRRSLHGRIGAGVRACCSVLTVEQVAQLAGLMEARRRRREWLDSRLGQEHTAPQPDGSIQLTLEPPIALHWSQTPGFDSVETGDGALEAELAQDQGPDEERQAVAPVAPWDSPVLPADPVELLTWLDGYERALVRRLRDLSHALNLELRRSGLSVYLLPLPLLEAALQGQLDPLPAPANLLRVQLPLPDPSQRSSESVALLVRPADLELEQPRLRTCRGRLQRHRQEVRRMAEQHRRLRRRLQALEAEKLWHQDSPGYREP